MLGEERWAVWTHTGENDDAPYPRTMHGCRAVYLATLRATVTTARRKRVLRTRTVQRSQPLAHTASVRNAIQGQDETQHETIPGAGGPR
jgi:hypothetical protein